MEPLEVKKLKNPQTNKLKVLASVLAGSVLLGAGAHQAKAINKETLTNNNVIQETSNTPFRAYGSFTDVNEYEQVFNRAVYYYEQFILNPSNPKNAGNVLNIDDIIDTIRMMNNEFIRDWNNEPIYNDHNLIHIANNLCTISNYDSIGTNYTYTPLTPLFLDGSTIQKHVFNIDNKMNEIVEAILNNDREGFVKLTKEWYALVENLFNNMDDPSIGPSSAFLAYHGIISSYSGTILEYSMNNNILVMVNADEDLQMAIERINNQPINDKGESFPEELYSNAKEYYNEKYENLSDDKTIVL